MKTCKICGREYKRSSCEYCARFKKWVDIILDVRLKKYLTPRIIDDLKTLPFPDIPKVESCYLYGKVGTGKTIKAATIFLQKQKEDYIDNIHNTYEFITIPNLLLKLRNIYETKEITETEFIEHYINIDFLVLDDFGVEKTTDWSLQSLYLIINSRYEFMKETVITSNLSLTEMARKLEDERIPSRIKQMCTIIHKTKNYRHGGK